MNKHGHEILILRRMPGYLRLHIPPLVYDAKAGYLLNRELSKVVGVRKIRLKPEAARLSIHYDELAVKESTLLLKIDRIASGLLKAEQQSLFERTIANVARASRRKVASIIVNAVIIVYLIKAHWMLARHHWFRRPAKNWWPLTVIGMIIYLHRRQIKETVKSGWGNAKIQSF